MCDNSLTDDDLKEQIAFKLADYRHPPEGGMNVEHISRWVNQFQPRDRRFILEETDRLMGIGYFPEHKYQRVITEIAEDEGNTELFENAAFLDIQEQGCSQHELMQSLCAELTEDIHVVTRTSRGGLVRTFRDFVYIDDVSFSGYKAISDLTWLIEHFQLHNITIYVYFLGCHTYSCWWVKNKLENDFLSRNITVEVNGGDFRRVENRLAYNRSSGVFWPVEQDIEIPEWAINSGIYTGIYRDGYIANDNFPDEQKRNRFESILTATGFDILAYSVNPKPVIKPLGFSNFNGVGFGGTTFTYRNCPNNTPLVFWWGNYEPTGNHALDCWYPLMKRMVYNQ